MDQFRVKTDDIYKKQRLDKFLTEKLTEFKPEISRSRVKMLIEQGNITNSDANICYTDCAYKIKGGEEFLITIPDPAPSQITAKNIAFDIIFEDQHMAVINKPAGLTTHPGNGNHQETLVNALLFHLGDKLSGINGVMRPGIVHRLDKDTSGLMVIAKSDTAHQELARQIQDRTLKRHYLALCFGVPKPLSGKIDKNITRSRVNRLKMTTVRQGGRRAITHYSVKKIYCKDLLSMVECRLDTGRTHQIRVHMTAIGHCLIGDQTYGNRKKSLNKIDENLKNSINNFPRQALHSYKIAFLHPITKEPMQFETDLPQDIKELEAKLANCIIN